MTGEEMTYEYIATCLFGLEHQLGEEIDRLGYERTETIDGRICFKGDIDAIARCNMWLRTAEHLYIKMGSFRAENFTDLFEGTKALPWENWISEKDRFPVKGHAIRSLLHSIPDCQKIVKKAVVDRLSSEYGISWFEETETKYQIEFFILNDVATLMIDTSGEPLFKRGYREKTGEAPLRETLSAAVSYLARPREDVLFWDPMCGSGTIPIEAALIMSNTAPGLKRSFAAEDFVDIPLDSFKRAREEAMDLIKRDCAFEAYASDIDPQCVEITRQNVKNAGMEKHIKVFVKNALNIETEGRRGTVVCNPPYGERLLDKKRAEDLYIAMGRHFKTLDNWQIYVLTSHDGFEKLYGRRADKKRYLYNGMLKCSYYQFFKRKDK